MLGHDVHTMLGHDVHTMLGHDTHAMLGHDTHAMLGHDTHTMLGHDTHTMLGHDTHTMLMFVSRTAQIHSQDKASDQEMVSCSVAACVCNLWLLKCLALGLFAHTFRLFCDPSDRAYCRTRHTCIAIAWRRKKCPHTAQQ